jgi:ubiquinone/menaquinone biosynthesis C-methylase UbiE
MSQKDILLRFEGNEWYKRNKHRLGMNGNDDPIINIFLQMEIKAQYILEIGCSNGWRINALQKLHNASYFGIDPSEDAIMDGTRMFPKISLQVGTAESLPFESMKFDVVIYGFCLYLCDRNDLFRIACEGDRVLNNNGALIIYDFNSPFPYWNKYEHDPRIKAYKMNYADMFTWNPSYMIIYHHMFYHSKEDKVDNPDERLSVTLLKKNTSAIPFNPFFENKQKSQEKHA